VTAFVRVQLSECVVTQKDDASRVIVFYVFFHLYSNSAPPLFGSKSTISRFGERFRDGQYSLVSFLFAVFLYLRFPRAQPFVKVGGGHVPRRVPHGVGATAYAVECTQLICCPLRAPESFKK